MSDRSEEHDQAIRKGGKDITPMPELTEAQSASPEFEAIWEAIKTWDINVPESYAGYCGANGSHVAVILNALEAKQ